jgi:hypothetical protein
MEKVVSPFTIAKFGTCGKSVECIEDYACLPVENLGRFSTGSATATSK